MSDDQPIPEEAVEAVMAAHYRDDPSEETRRLIRADLQAAAPVIRAQALEQARRRQ